MHFRRLASFLLGLWLGGSLFMAFVATHSLRSVDKLIGDSGPFSPQIDVLGRDAARALLRHQASELTRTAFAVSEWAQIVVGALFLLSLLAGSRQSRFSIAVAAAMLLIVLFFRFFLTPHLTELGRALEMQGSGLSPDDRTRFWDFHNAYFAFEILKWLLGFGLMVKFTLPTRRSSELPDNINSIDKAHHRHVDR